MKVLVIPDKFKGSLTSSEVCEAVSEAILSVDSSTEIVALPMADGGEGTCGILTRICNGKMHYCQVTDPLGKRIDSFFGVSPDGTTAFVEMASASGLGLIPEAKRNPAYTTTVGTGQLIKHALDAGVKKIILGIGGSATNDAGTGMAHALGVQFYDADGNDFVPTGITLSKIKNIDVSSVDVRIRQTECIVLCDVQNPLYGRNGAAHVFASQKGAGAAMIDLLDDGLNHFAECVKKQFSLDLNFPGAGAAGGMGAGAKLFLNASLTAGIDFIMDFAGVQEQIRKCDLVITGEGRVDGQSLSGKVISGVARRCAEFSKHLWIVTGKNQLSEQQLRDLGVSKVIAILDGSISEQDAISNAYPLLAEKLASAFNEFYTRPDFSTEI